MLPFSLAICTTLLLLITSAHPEQSFYELLGVPPDADTRTIRKAFKRLAIQKHPDKNPDDPDAHSVFVRINRAYEVLKDDELRRKYDQFGEKGLEDGHQGNGQQYQSWQFYRDNFGIYDDDPEIVTLSRADFQEEVFESGEVWFVNFYSTFCSHCHALAPTWREFAKAMDGVVRIGAVNCAEDPELCQSQQVLSYPSLVLFPQRIWFQELRDLDSLVAFLLPRLPYHPLFPTNPAQFPNSTRPLLIEICDHDDTEDCFSDEERMKCAAIIARLSGQFAVLECAHGARELCNQVYQSGSGNGVYFFPEGRKTDENAKELFFADLVDLRSQLLQLLPPLPRLDADKLNWLLNRSPGADSTTMLVIFSGVKEQPEWRTLSLRFHDMDVNLMFCTTEMSVSPCAQLHLGELPRPVLFRASGGFDIHYGNLPMDAHQIAKFLARSRHSSLVVLSPREYSRIAGGATELWLVDHFAPWCPPCLRLLAELRRMPAQVDGRTIRVGSLDCDAHRATCRGAGVNSYPHSILLTPDGARHSLVGFHALDQLLDFITESLNPSVETLDAASFARRVLQRPPGQLFFVDFYAPWCGPCQQLAPEFRRLARQFAQYSHYADQISFGAVDCQANGALCDQEYVQNYPTLRLYRHRADIRPYDYPPNWWRTSSTMAQWLGEMMPSLVLRLAGDFHSTVLGAQEPFLVDFYAPWCSHCVQFAPTFEQLAKLLEGEVQLGKVDCDRFGHICQMAGIQAYPAVRLYLGAEHAGSRQNVQGLTIQHIHDAKEMVRRVREIIHAKKGSWSEKDEL